MPTMPPSLLPKAHATTNKPTWTECTVIFRETCGRIRAVDGVRYGTLAVHVTQDGNLEQGAAPVTVTHTPSKTAVGRTATVEDAMALAERLWDEAREALHHPGEEIDRSKIPAATMDWLRRCFLERRCV